MMTARTRPKAGDRRWGQALSGRERDEVDFMVGGYLGFRMDRWNETDRLVCSMRLDPFPGARLQKSETFFRGSDTGGDGARTSSEKLNRGEAAVVLGSVNHIPPIMNPDAEAKITLFPTENPAFPISSVDQAFVKLTAAILEEPEEMVLAALLASRGRARYLKAA